MGLRTMPPITRLDLASVVLPDWHPAASQARIAPVYGFLIEHPDGAIVVDTGVGFDNRFIDELYSPTRERIDVQLRTSGVALDDVVAVVNSHLHFDHCGQNPALFGTETRFFAQQSEFATVEADPVYTDARWALPPIGQRRSVVGDEEIAEGVTIIATPGHTAGHQSVVVEAGERKIVIGAQVVWDSAEFVDETASDANVDPDPELRRAAVASIRRIRALRPDAVHFSHCSSLTLA